MFINGRFTVFLEKNQKFQIDKCQLDSRWYHKIYWSIFTVTKGDENHNDKISTFSYK